jgi:hypothetical protein
MKSGPVDWYTPRRSDRRVRSETTATAPLVPDLPRRGNRRLRSASTMKTSPVGPPAAGSVGSVSRNGPSRRLRSRSTARVPSTFVLNVPPQSGSVGSVPRPQPKGRKAPKFKMTVKMTRKNARSIKRRNLIPGKCPRKEIQWVLNRRREFAKNALAVIQETQKPRNKQNRQLLIRSAKAVFWIAKQLVSWPWRGACVAIITSKEISLFLTLISQRLVWTTAGVGVAVATIAHILNTPVGKWLIFRGYHGHEVPQSDAINRLRWYSEQPF